MLGALIIVVVMVLVLPPLMLISGGVVAAILGKVAKDDAEARHEGSELIDLNR